MGHDIMDAMDNMSMNVAFVGKWVVSVDGVMGVLEQMVFKCG